MGIVDINSIKFINRNADRRKFKGIEKEGIEYYNKNIKPYKYCRQKELDELECKWRENVV